MGAPIRRRHHHHSILLFRRIIITIRDMIFTLPLCVVTDDAEGGTKEGHPCLRLIFFPTPPPTTINIIGPPFRCLVSTTHTHTLHRLRYWSCKCRLLSVCGQRKFRRRIKILNMAEASVHSLALNGNGHAFLDGYANGNGHVHLHHANGNGKAASTFVANGNRFAGNGNMASSNGSSANSNGFSESCPTASSTVDSNGVSAHDCAVAEERRRCFWYEEDLDEDLRWCFSLNSVLHTGVSKYQDIALLDTQHFGKALILDGKMQSAEADEFIYHELLVHPALISHPNPKNVFIMGGGEGSTARETLRHKTVKQVVMCDIDKEVVDFCRKHLVINREAFLSNRLELVINDARAELENRKEHFDVIVGDLADPMEGGPCYQLYTKSFYQNILKPKLSQCGVFVTQAGPAGVLTHREVFSSIYNTLRQVFKYVVPYNAHIPSFADTWGWVMASDHPLITDAATIDSRIMLRIKGELRYLDGLSFVAASTLNKSVRTSLAKETHVYTEETARFVYGHGKAGRRS